VEEPLPTLTHWTPTHLER